MSMLRNGLVRSVGQYQVVFFDVGLNGQSFPSKRTCRVLYNINTGEMETSGFFVDDRITSKCAMTTSGKRTFGQALLVPAVIWAGTKGLAMSPQIRPPAWQPLVPVRYNPLVPV
jgi:hypothetical protein